MSAEVKVFRKYKLPAVLSICRCFFFWFRSRSFTTIFHNTSYTYTPIPSRYDCARPVLQQKHETCMVFVKLYSIFTYIHRIWAYDVRLKVIVLCVALSWRYSDSLPQHNDERFGIKLNIVAIDTHKSTEEETKKNAKENRAKSKNITKIIDRRYTKVCLVCNEPGIDFWKTSIICRTISVQRERIHCGSTQKNIHHFNFIENKKVT